jgi:copper chaperone CopZ
MKSYYIALTLLLMGTLARADTIEMKVFGMVCGFCAQGIEANLRKNPATEEVVVSLEDKLVAVRTRAGTSIADADLRKAIADAGYDLKAISRTGRSLEEVRKSLAAAPKS